MKIITLATYLSVMGIIFNLPSRVSAQTDYNKINIASPNAASLGKFVDIPVNYHTGIPQINIPLYTVKDGSLELPVSLSYHAGGVKVAEQASWVGAGWALNAGGVITRTVRGIPDEAVNTHLGQKGHFSNYGFSSYYASNLSGDNATDVATHDLDVLKGVYDGEPDLFFFNFNGHSGKFYFTDDRKPILVSADEDLKIDYFYGLAVSSATFLDKNIQGFCITTGDGTKYFFGKTEVGTPAEGVYPVEISIPYDISNGLSSDRVVSSWYLNKVESADKLSSIKLVYDAESYSSYSWSYSPISGDISSTNNGYSIYKLYVSGVRLSKINFSQGTVLFSVASAPRLDLASGNLTAGDPAIELANTEAKALKEITISNNNHALKKISFYSSYFQGDQTALPYAGISMNLVTDVKRLKLDSLVETGAEGSALKPYKFDYYSNFLPRRLSFSLDHWGFYNAAPNSTVLPTLTMDTYTVINPNGANRDSSWPAMQEGTLNKVTYPTGGYTTLEFEANKAKVDAVRYNLQYVTQYSVGFDGGSTKEWPNVSLTGNEKYELTFVNNQCATGITNCTATYNIYDSGGNSVYNGGAGPGEIKKTILSIPAGIYKIKMYKDGAYSGTGAILTISKYVSTAIHDPIIGGLRIKKITKNAINNTSSVVTESYSYEDSGRSTGVLYERPYYIAPLRSDLLARFGFAAVIGVDGSTFPGGCVFYSLDPSRSTVPFVISPVSAVPMANVRGNHIGYSSVRVDQSLNGYSIYKYYSPNVWENNVNDVAYRNLVSKICDSSSPSFPNVPLPFDFERGELKSEYHFDANDLLLKSTYYTFSFDSTKVYTPALIVKDVPGLARSLAEYQLRGYWKKSVIQNETIIDRSTLKEIYKSDTTFYSSAFHRSPTRKSTDLTKGGVLVTNFKYVSDFRLPATESISDGWDNYQNGCTSCYTSYLDKISVPGTSAGSKKILFHNYRMCVAIARKNYVDYQRTNFSGPDNTFASTHLNAKNNAESEFKAILEMQDQFINSPVEITEFNNGKLSGAAFNTFAFEPNTTNTYLANVSKVKLVAPLAADYLRSGNTNSAVTKDSRYTTDFLYKNSSGNIVEQSKYMGTKEVLLWGYKNKYPVAKVLASDYAAVSALISQSVLDNIATTDAQMRTELNKIRVNLPNAQVTTYTYDPLVGITSQTDAKGQTTFYEYDEFQRLKNIKDQQGNIIRSNVYHYKN